MKSRIVKGLATLGLVGLLGCSEAPKELDLWGYIKSSQIKLSSNHSIAPNTARLVLGLDCSGDYRCRDLDLRYHGENREHNTILADLECGTNVPNLSKADGVHFTLYEGFEKSGQTAVGDPLYWINTMPAKGRLLEYFK